MHRDRGEHRGSGAQSRLRAEMGQREKTAWLGLEIHGEGGKRGETEEQLVQSEECGEDGI